MMTKILVRRGIAVWLLVHCIQNVAIAADRGTPSASSLSSEYLSRSMVSARTLNRRWLTVKHGGVDWNGINAWQRFEIIEALTDYSRLSHDRQFLSGIEQAVDNRAGLDGNDDDLWALIASVDVWSMTRGAGLLSYAEQTFARVTRTYWDSTCGGGLWWDHARTYKNAITNELLIYASTILYSATRKPEYQAWALKALDWFNASSMINPNGLINDGLSATCHNNGQLTYTYNQGVILGSLANLYRLTGNHAYLDQALRLADASTSTAMAPDGILREAGGALSKDGASFKGIYVRHLGYLYAVLAQSEGRKTIASFLQANAAKAWGSVASGNMGSVNAYWDDGGRLFGAAAQGTGIDLFNAASLTAP